MPQDGHSASQRGTETHQSAVTSSNAWQHVFSTPQPIKQLFDRFPLTTYHPNDLPERTAKRRNQHALYIFTTDHDAERGAASFNPGCLKWQVSL